jgi:hypothetical protein
MGEAFVAPVVVGLVVVIVVALIVISHFSDPSTRDDREPGTDGDIDDLLDP